MNHTKRLALGILVVFSATGKADAQVSKNSLKEHKDKSESIAGMQASNEIIEMRTKNAKHFRNPNGSFTAVTGRTYHYKDANGRWQNIDLSLKSTEKNGYSYTNETNEFKSYLPQNAGTGSIKMVLKNGVEFNWWGQSKMRFSTSSTADVQAKQVKPSQQGTNILNYTNVYEGITEQFEMLENGIENNTIFHNLSSQIKSLPQGATVEFSQFIPIQKNWSVDVAGLKKSNNFSAKNFHINIPGTEGIYFGDIVVFDNTIDKSKALYLTYAPSNKLSSQEKILKEKNILVSNYEVIFLENGIQVISKVSADWLKATGRKFPVTVDPTVTITPPSPTGDYYAPTSNWYGFQRHANLYLASEIGVSNVSITAIEYNRTSTSGTNAVKPYKVFMRTTTASTLTSAAWNSTTYTGGLTPVYDASIDFHGTTAGWKMFTLTTPFLYTGDNLIVMVNDAYGGGGSAKYLNRSSSVTGRQAGNRVDNTDPGDAVTISTESYLPEIRITYNYTTPCTGVPNAGTIATSVPDSVCPNIAFTLAADGLSFGSGMDYQWQRSATGAAGSWTDIAGAINPTYIMTTGINTATYFRLKSICSGSTPVYTNEKQIHIKPLQSCYCTPTGGTSSSSYYVNSLTTTGGSTNLNYTASSYTQYVNATATQIVTQFPGQSFTANMNLAGGGTHYYQAWIDWNNNGSFGDPGENVYSVTSYTAPPVTFTVNIPAAQAVGSYRMRVTSDWLANATSNNYCGPMPYGNFVDVTVNVVALQPCTAITYPTNVVASASPDNLCLTGSSNLSINTNFILATGQTFQWQSSPNGTTWTDITGATNQTYSATGISATTHYRFLVKCNGNTVVTSAPDTVVINSPGSVTTTAGSRCGPGQVALSATPVNAGNSVIWYQNATGGIALATGNTFNTPYLSNTTTFYAVASTSTTAPPPPTWVGTGTTSNSTPNPYYTGYWGSKNQFIIRASEMTAAGLSAGTINSISFQTTGTFAMNLANYTVKMGTTALTAMPAAYQTGLTTVFTAASYTPTLGLNTHLLTTPFVWDGVSNIIIETCYNNGAYSSGFSIVGSSYSYNPTYYGYADNATVCSGTPTYNYTSTFRPNIRFDITLGCQGPRVPVIATITSGPAITKTVPPVVCNNSITPVSVTLPAGQYTPYKFYPNTNLYSDAAATIPYTGSAATTVYFRSNTSGQHTFYALGGDTTAAGAGTICSRADTFKIWVQPASNTIKATPDTVCVSGTTKLTLQTDTNFYAGSIQWQQSIDGGLTYTNIAGANGVSYTTPVLTTNRKYRAVISAGSNVCYNVNKDIFVVVPQLISSQGAQRCGPGSLNLSAVPGANASIKWYENATGGLPVGTGNAFTTPSLPTTTTYYVTAGSGGTPSAPIWFGNGTNTVTSNPNPFATGWYGQKHQYLIRASELTAAGLSAGNITEIAFDVVSNSGIPMNGLYFAMKNTTATTLSTTWETGLTNVYTSTTAFMPTANSANAFTLQTPFAWDGVSNIIIESCFNNTSYTSGHSVKYTTSLGFNATHYYYADNSTVCSAPGAGYTATSRPNIRLIGTIACETPRQPVIATINPIPSINLGNDLDTCVDVGLSFTVDAAPQPNNATYLWDNGATTSTRSINQSGVYHVAVTNQFGCVGYDTLNISIKDNPVVNLAAGGVNLCIGGQKTLDAGPDGENGGGYYWNTGATTRTINVTNAGTYIVYVTSPEGCVKIDTVDIVLGGHMPEVDGILVTPQSSTNFILTANNPNYVVDYIWDFGDGSPQVTTTSPTTSHQYAANGNFWVKLYSNSVCGQVMDSIMVTIIGVSINDLDNQTNLKVYPNPTHDNVIFVETADGIQVNEIKIVNMLGQEVYSNNKLSNSTKHRLQLSSHLSSGLYHIKIMTNKGLTTRKIELLK